MAPVATQAERRAATRTRLLESARHLFVRNGYDTTTITDVLDDAGLSRGALYHHFDSKEALAEALFAATSRRTIQAGSQAVPEGLSPVESLVSACLAWLDQACRPETAAILFQVGPTALGWERCREIENAHSLLALRHGITAAVEAGELDPPSVELAAITLNAVLGELALALVHDPTGTRRADVDKVVRGVVGSFAGLDAVRPSP